MTSLYKKIMVSGSRLGFSCLLLTFFSLVLSLGSCTDSNTVPEGPCSPLQVSVSGKPFSRDLFEGSLLPAGSAIGVGLFTTDYKAYPGGPYPNVQFTTADGTDWSATPAPLLTATEARAAAYYPYLPSVTDVTAIPVSLTEGHDYLYSGWVDGLDNFSPSAQFHMQHALSRIKVVVHKDDTFIDEAVLQRLSVYSDRLYASATLNAGTGLLDNFKGAQTPVSFDGLSKDFSVADASFDFMVIPDRQPGTLVFDMTISGVPYTASIKCDNALQQGKCHTYTLTLLPEVIKVSPAVITPIDDVVTNNDSFEFVDIDDLFEDAVALSYNAVAGKEVTLYNSSATASIARMAINGQEVDVARYQTYTPATSGTFEVKFLMNDITTLDKTPFSGLKDLATVDIPLRLTNIGPEVFGMCPNLVSITVDSNNPVYDSRENCNGIVLTSINRLISGCKNTVIPSTVTSIGNYAFKGCTGLTSITIPSTSTDIGSYAFSECSNLTRIISLATSAPVIYNNTFHNVETNGFLIVPSSYQSEYSSWLSSDDYYLGKYKWIITEEFSPTECLSLSITADNVHGRKTFANINYTAVCNGINAITGVSMSDVTLTGTVVSDIFGQNPSTTAPRDLSVSFTCLGKTASANIVQTAYKAPYYTVDLNSQWQTSSVENPDATLYEGVYESFSNYNVNSTAAVMTIKVFGYTSFTIYIRSYAESSYDYVMASVLDQTIDNNTSYSNTSLVKAHTSSLQNNGTAIGNYKAVTYDVPDDDAEHTITIVYRKDNSSHSGSDKGYLLIKKP